jgi:hypothetical protein
VILPVTGNDLIGGVRSPVAFNARAGAGEAAIERGSRNLVRSSEGAVMALWDRDGSVRSTHVLQAADGFAVPLLTGAISVYPLRGPSPSARVTGSEWSGVRAIAATGSLIARVPRGATLVMYVENDAPLEPRRWDGTSDAVDVQVAALGSGDAPARLAALQQDGLERAAFDPGRPLYRIQAAVPSEASAFEAVHLALGGIPTAAVARLTATDVGEAHLYRVDTGGLLRIVDRVTDRLQMGRDWQSQLIGHGWSPVEVDDVSPYRWIAGPAARVLLPLTRDGASAIAIQAFRGTEDAQIAPVLNGQALPAQSLGDGWHVYEWRVPAGVLVRGTNDLVLALDSRSPQGSETASRNVAVDEVRVTYAPTGPGRP